MKKILFLVFIGISSSAFSYAQSAESNTRSLVLLSDKKGVFSIELPAKPTAYVKRADITLWAIDDGVDVTVRRRSNSAGRTRAVSAGQNLDSEAIVQTFEVKDYLGKVIKFDNGKSLRSWIVFSNDEWYFDVSVSAMVSSNSRYNKLLESIKIYGTPLFRSEVQSYTPSSTVLIDELETDQVVRSFLLNAEKSRPVIRYGTVRKVLADTGIEGDVGARAPFKRTRYILLERPKPSYTASSRERMINGTVRASVQLLANGSIGEIVIDPTLDKGIAKSVAKAAAGIRFVPAQVDGVYVDSVIMIEYLFSIG